MSCLVHGDSSGAGGSSCCGHGGHSSHLSPCRWSGSGCWGTLWGPLTPRHAQRKPQLPSQPRRASCGLSCPVPVCLAPEGCPVLSCSCVFSPGGLSMYCPVCLALEGSLYPLTSPGKLGGGKRVPAVGAGPRGHGHKDHLPWPPELPAVPWPPEPLAMPWPPELPAPPWPPELPAPPWPPLSVCSALEFPVLCSCPCLSWGASRAPTPPPRWNCYGVGHAFREGGVMSGFCCVCVICSCLLCPYLVCFLSSSDVVMS